MFEYLFSPGIIFYVIVRNWENEKKNSVIIWGIEIEAYEFVYPKTKYMKNIKCESVTICK